MRNVPFARLVLLAAFVAATASALPAAAAATTASTVTTPTAAVPTPPAAAPRATTTTTAPAAAAATGGSLVGNRIANPASSNCIDRGGALSIEKNAQGAEFGVCTFAGNRQCEEWAMLRGECPVGGVPVANLPTPAARYCVISGGRFVATPDGQGNCAFGNGKTCPAPAFYDSNCSRTQPPTGK